MTTLETFRDTIAAAARGGTLRDGLIGENILIPGLTGDVPLVYADYVASGRALRQVEAFISSEVLPYYANSHTEASYCGAHMTRLRKAARAEIARLVGAGEEDAVIFAGSGATAGLNRLVSLLGVNEAATPVVLIGPYEHHSNILPWRESRAKVVEIPEAADGGPDLAALKAALIDHAGADLLIGSFSAASNVTGIVTDADAVTRLLKTHGAVAVWDYAGAGPYLPIDMGRGTDAAKDAIVVSPHKFPGGPGASGVLVVNSGVVRRTRPCWPGGGTVAFVSPWGHEYSRDLAAREEAGTPNVIGDIRAALAFLVKDAVGAEVIAEREARYNAMALEGWSDNPHLTLLGADKGHRLPIFSFMVRDGAGRPGASAAVHPDAQRHPRHPGARRLRLRGPLRAPAAGHRPAHVRGAAGRPAGGTRVAQARLGAAQLQLPDGRGDGALHHRQRERIEPEHGPLRAALRGGRDHRPLQGAGPGRLRAGFRAFHRPRGWV